MYIPAKTDKSRLKREGQSVQLSRFIRQSVSLALLLFKMTESRHCIIIYAPTDRLEAVLASR